MTNGRHVVKTHWLGFVLALNNNYDYNCYRSHDHSSIVTCIQLEYLATECILKVKMIRDEHPDNIQIHLAAVDPLSLIWRQLYRNLHT